MSWHAASTYGWLVLADLVDWINARDPPKWLWRSVAALVLGGQVLTRVLQGVPPPTFRADRGPVAVDGMWQLGRPAWSQHHAGGRGGPSVSRTVTLVSLIRCIRIRRARRFVTCARKAT